MVRVTVDMLDAAGRIVNEMSGVAIDGPMRAAHGFSYHPQGCVLDKIGTLTFTAPLVFPRNNALRAGSQVRLIEDGVEMARAVVPSRPVRPAKGGLEAQFACADLLDELRRATCTSGFTVPDVANGAIVPLTTILTRLVACQTDATWAVANSLATLDGIEFSAYGLSVVEAVAKLSKERTGAHFRRGAGRTLEFGRFGASSGLRLIRETPTAALTARNPDVRQIRGETFAPAEDGAIVNDVVPTGAGSGVAQLTLAPLYLEAGQVPLGPPGWYRGGSGSFSGVHGLYPVCRRPRLDGGGLDGYDYFLQDTPSVVAHGRYMATLPISSIAAIDTAPTNQFTAAIALYAATVAWIVSRSTPRDTITCATEGRGDIRGIAGNTVRVVYRDVPSGYDINADYVVHEVLRSYDAAGVCTDTWTLSRTGATIQDGLSILVGGVQAATNITAVPQQYIIPAVYPFDERVDATNHCTVRIYGDASISKILVARFTFELLPLDSTLKAGTIPDHTHDVDATALAAKLSTQRQPLTASEVEGHLHEDDSTHRRSVGGQFSHQSGTDTEKTTTEQAAYTHGAPGRQGTHGHTDVDTSGSAETGTATTGTFDPAATISIASGGSTTTNLLSYDGNYMRSSGASAPNGVRGSVVSNQVLAAKDTSHSHAVKASGKTVSPESFGGLTPSVNQHPGFQPLVMTERYGGAKPQLGTNTAGLHTPAVNPYAATPLTTLTLHTTKTTALGFTPIYGIFKDGPRPGYVGRASGVGVYVNGILVAGPYDGAINTIDLRAYLPAQTEAVVEFRTATPGRIRGQGFVKAIGSTIRVNPA